MSDPARIADVHLDGSYVQGFPMLAALDLRARAGVTMRIVNASVPSTLARVGLQVWDAQGSRLVYEIAPLGPPGDQPAARSATLEGDRRVLVDLSASLRQPLEPGEYRVRIGYPLAGAVWSNAVTVSVREPTPTDAAIRVAAEAEAPTARGWNDWATEIPARPLDPLPTAVHGPLRYHRTVRNLLFSQRALADITEQDLAELDGLLVPEREAICIEVSMARRDLVAAHGRANALVQAVPGLRVWAEAALAGNGPLGNLRDALRAVADW